MLKIFMITTAIYVFFELTCHGFALFAARIAYNSTMKKAGTRVSQAYLKHTFYRLMLILSVVAMNHLYIELVLIETDQSVRFVWSFLFIICIVSTVLWLNALVVRSVLREQNHQQSVSAVFKQKISYIMWHFRDFYDICHTQSYLKKSKWINRILSVLAFILLFMDLQLLFNIAHS